MGNTKFMTLIAVAAVTLTAAGAFAKEGGPGARMNFDTLDANADGRVTREEMSALRADRFDAVDANSDGFLSLAELEAHGAERARERATRMMGKLDANGDGQLSQEEMSSGNRLDKMFDRVDADGDGAITESEFEAAKANMRGRFGERSDR